MSRVQKKHSAPGQTRPSKARKAGPRTPYGDLNLPVNSDDSQINAAYAHISLRIHIDPDDPHSIGHARLAAISDAKAILQDRSMRRVVDMCYNRIYNKDKEIRCYHFLGINKHANNAQIKAAYETQMRRWIGYERYIDAVATCMKDARDWMYKENKLKADQEQAREKAASPEDTGNAAKDSVSPIER